jgi:hypothetical protein
LEQQREQNGGISRERIQHRVLLGGIEEYLADGAVRKIANVHPVTMAGVLDVERDRNAAMWQASPGGHGVRLRCCQQASLGAEPSEILLCAEVRSFIKTWHDTFLEAPVRAGAFLFRELLLSLIAR